MKKNPAFFCSIVFSMLFNLLSISFAGEPAIDIYPAYEHPSYYYGDKYSDIDGMDADTFRAYLNQTINYDHIRSSGRPDRLVEKCGPESKASQSSKCYPVRWLSYQDARVYLFGHVFIESDETGQFFIEPIYCDQKKYRGVAKNRLPTISESGLNTEHVFPQSHFKQSAQRHRFAEMKTDIHHLAPSLMKVNSFRGSFHFGVPNDDRDSVDGCPESVRGRGEGKNGGQVVFLPRRDVRGDVARMVFYFSVRFDAPINEVEEKTLREWHETDPVSDQEYARNSRRYTVQGNRNPFVDFPGFVSKIRNF